MKKIELIDTYGIFKKNINRLKTITLDEFVSNDNWPIIEIAEYSVLRLQDSYNCFMRDLILGLAAAKARTQKGIWISPAPVPVYDQFGDQTRDRMGALVYRYLNSRQDALDYLRKTWNRDHTVYHNSRRAAHGRITIQVNPHHWEPKWFDDRNLQKTMDLLNVNAPNILGIHNHPINPIPEMRPIRNYSAHRTITTGVEFRHLVPSGKIRRQPASYIMDFVLDQNGDRAPRFETWCGRLELMGKMMIS